MITDRAKAYIFRGALARKNLTGRPGLEAGPGIDKAYFDKTTRQRTSVTSSWYEARGVKLCTISRVWQTLRLPKRCRHTTVGCMLPDAACRTIQRHSKAHLPERRSGERETNLPRQHRCEAQISSRFALVAFVATRPWDRVARDNLA